jgi:hypothetical protein
VSVTDAEVGDTQGELWGPEPGTYQKIREPLAAVMSTSGRKFEEDGRGGGGLISRSVCEVTEWKGENETGQRWRKS